MSTILSGETMPKSDSLPGSSARPAALALAGPLIIVALCCIRSPGMMAQGRFWAEDSMFFGHMLASHSFLEKVSYVYKGHLELISALSHAAASYLDVKMAPLFTSYVDLLIECILAYLLIIFRRDLGMRLAPAVAICILLVVSPCASEHYLNVLNSQWLTSAILFVVIILPEHRLKGHPVAVVLASLVLGLSGISSTSLLPLAVLYAVRRRSRPHALIAAALLACCVIQGALIVTHEMGNRFLPVSPYVYVVAPFLQVVVKHLMGVDAENNLAEWFRNGPMAAGIASSFVVLPAGLLAWMTRRIYQDRLSEIGLLLLSFLFVTLFNEVGAVGDRNNMVGIYMMRYFFLPSFIIAIVLARLGARPEPGGIPLMHGVLFLAVAVSTVDFFMSGYNTSLVTVQRSWRQDVDRCHAQAGACRVDISPGGYYIEIPARRS